MFVGLRGAAAGGRPAPGVGTPRPTLPRRPAPRPAFTRPRWCRCSDAQPAEVISSERGPRRSARLASPPNMIIVPGLPTVQISSHATSRPLCHQSLSELDLNPKFMYNPTISGFSCYPKCNHGTYYTVNILLHLQNGTKLRTSLPTYLAELESSSRPYWQVPMSA